MINLFESANLIDGVDTIDDLIEFLSDATLLELLAVYNDNKDKSEEEMSKILVETLLSKI